MGQTYSSRTEAGRHGGGFLTSELTHLYCVELRAEAIIFETFWCPLLPVDSIFPMLSDWT